MNTGKGKSQIDNKQAGEGNTPSPSNNASGNQNNPGSNEPHRTTTTPMTN